MEKENNKYMLEIEQLVKVYGGKSKKTAVNGLSLKVARGDFFGLLGPNGAGKSSTIGCITGTAKITGGTIRVGDFDVETDYRDARRLVGISAQEFNVDIFATVRQLIMYMGGYYGVPHAKRAIRTNELIKRFSLEEHADKPFRELSGGLKRRAILARALIHDPELLILDEPTAGIDVEERHRLWKFLQELNAEGKTIILTSHYLEEVEHLCRNIAVINNGIIVANDTKEHFTQNGRTLEQAYLSITKGEHF